MYYVGHHGYPTVLLLYETLICVAVKHFVGHIYSQLTLSRGDYSW